MAPNVEKMHSPIKGAKKEQYISRYLNIFHMRNLPRSVLFSKTAFVVVCQSGAQRAKYASSQ